VRCSLVFCGLIFSTVLSAVSLCNGDPRPKSACAGWESLQQLRSLIPERMWEQEFSVSVNRKAFEKAEDKWASSKKIDDMSCTTTGSSRFYLLRSTFSGENIRLLDRYQEFQASPFWNNPNQIDELNSIEKGFGQ
jgi:hypothetical protein